MQPLEKKVYDGDEARMILESDTWQWMFSATETELTEHLCKPTSNAEDLLRTNLALALLRRLREQMQTRMETGKLAALELEHKRTLYQRAKNALGGIS